MLSGEAVMTQPERNVDEIDYEMATPLFVSRDVIEKVAEDFSAGYDYSPGTSLTAMVSRYGGALHWKDFVHARQGSDSIDVRAIGDFDIFVAKHATEIENRYTVAHELGHYILHYWLKHQMGQVVGPMRASRYGNPDDWAEVEANWFAPAYLMRKAETEKAFKRLGRSAAAVASHFLVPLEIAEARLQHLQVIATPAINDERSRTIATT